MFVYLFIAETTSKA